MRAAALSTKGLTSAISEGTVEMRGLLTPDECRALAPPLDIEWDTEEPEDPTRSWSHSPNFRFGEQVSAVNPDLQTFMSDFRDLVQQRANEAEIPELADWGNAVNPDRPVELIGFPRSAYVAKWHRTPANHRIGWHTDDTFEQARGKREFGVRALGMMVAVNLTEYGGDYECAPRDATTYPKTPVPSRREQIRQIEGIGLGDAVGFLTARDMQGGMWVGSWPLHQFIAKVVEADAAEGVWRDSLVLAFQDVSARSLRTIGVRGVFEAVKARIPLL